MKTRTGDKKEYWARILFRKKAETRTNSQKIEHVILTPHSIPTETATKIHEDAINSPLSVGKSIKVSNMTQEPLNIPEISSIIVDETTTGIILIQMIIVKLLHFTLNIPEIDSIIVDDDDSR